ncbi:MAG: hypothetical protein ACREUY_01555, partial [Burkholderiales bacterium]
MLARLEPHSINLSATALRKTTHVLFVLPKMKTLSDVPAADTLRAQFSRRGLKPEELAQTPLCTTLPHGGLASWVMLD